MSFDYYGFCDKYKHLSIGGDSESIIVRIPGTGIGVTSSSSVSFSSVKYGGWEQACEQALKYRSFMYQKIGYKGSGVQKEIVRKAKRRSSNTGVRYVYETMRKNGQGCKKKVPFIQWSKFMWKDGKRIRRPQHIRIKNNRDECIEEARRLSRKNRLEHALDTDNLEDLYPITVDDITAVFTDFKIMSGKLTLRLLDIDVLYQLIYPRLYDWNFFPGVRHEEKAKMNEKLSFAHRSWKKSSRKGFYKIQDTWRINERYVYVSLNNAEARVEIENVVITL